MEKSTSDNVKAGMAKLCNDFTERIAQFGFKRKNSRSRSWVRHSEEFVEEVCFYRHGSSRGGPPYSNSVDIGVEFLVKTPEGTVKEFLRDHLLRDSRGYCYHTRFNALTWSTYDKCVDDLMRLMNDHGFPWFKTHGA
jgi:hypothetical protein